MIARIGVYSNRARYFVRHASVLRHISTMASQPELAQNACIAGAYDGFVYDYSSPFAPAWEQAGALHYEACLSKAKMSNGQLAANVLNFVSDKPKLQTGPVQLALIEYLFAASGAPPKK
jgi:hypothetical protein